MNESKIHSLIRTELQTQYELAKDKWLSDLSKKSFDIDWEPDWDWLRCETAVELTKGEVEDYLYNKYGDAYTIIMDGMVMVVWETMDFDLETTKDNLRTDGKPPVSLDDKMESFGVRY